MTHTTTLMRSRLAAAAATLPLISAGMFLAAGSASANPSGGAIVINDSGCGLFDGDGGFAFADSDHTVITPNGNGLLTCKATVQAPTAGHAVRFDFASTGALCGTFAGVTTKWHETVSASGQATLVCHVKS